MKCRAREILVGSRSPKPWARWAVLVAMVLATVCGVGAPAHAQAAGGPAGVVPASRKAQNLVVIPIHGEIDSQGVMAASVRRRVEMAERAGADALVFDIDSPGGDLSSVLAICNTIKGSTIKKTAAWINHDAYSGGAVVALACREIVINDPANFGDAKVVAGGPLGLTGQAIPRELLKKLLPPLIAEVVDSARRHNQEFGAYLWDEYLVQALVADDVELWLARHKTTGQTVCIDRAELESLFPGASPGGPARLAGAPGTGSPGPAMGTAPGGDVPAGSPKLAAVANDVAARLTVNSARPAITAQNAAEWDVVEKVTDGSAAATLKAADMVYFRFAANDPATGGTGITPIRNQSDLKAFFGAKYVLRYEPSWSEGLVVFLTNIWVRGILIVVFLLAMFVEMTHPGVMAPGAVALIALVALIAPPMLLGMAGWWEVAAIVAGVLLLLVEIFVIPGFGVTGVAGVVLLFAGLVGTFVPAGSGLFPDSPQGKEGLLDGAVVTLLACVTACVGIYLIGRHFGSLPVLGRLVLKTHADDEEVGLLAAIDPDTELAARVGDRGVAITPMRPAGRVQVGERVIDAVAEFGYIPPGAAVKVVSVDGMRVGVDAAG